jgi:hypothetical protein
MSAHTYQLPSYIALPKAGQAANLLVIAAPSASHVAFSTFRMEPAYMVLGHSVGIWAALASGNTSGNTSSGSSNRRRGAGGQPQATGTRDGGRGNVRGVAMAALNAELVRTGQVLKIPAYIPPEGPPHPHPPRRGGIGYSCSAAFKKCLGSTCSLGGGDCYNTSAGCGAGCAPLAADAWLAFESHSGFALVKQQATMAIKSTSAQSWLKKTEAHSSSLPPTQKRLVHEGTILPIVENAPLSSHSYWLVTLKEGGH